MFNGEFVRVIRKQKNYTLKQLAEKTSLSTSLLSQIERGLIDPTVSTFWKISNALNVPVNDFFHPEGEKHVIIRKQDRRIVDIQNENVSYHYLSPVQAGKMEHILVEIKPGELLQHELVSHAGEECGYVLKGELIVVLHDKEVFLHEGDSIYFPSTVPHRYINPGTGISLSVWAMTN
ncbi:XRE family transcriptional regulator [Aneurinibacillus sp. Ricciae_BoGa-3]|uniref:helix-turn-helix domain-containing protein n=1 Tax=Aneurinibacillus sp. Ricciae_BoGa-3 TaxID=3022697 RepID=UPI00233FD6D9|nr:XRE family transcriptional regulator [Aneurinibacillus sp. Ricciae_BoGa-3]WCK52656.1 XRE family transcriptional regulator [Aneurinibacillus sp. Ricciae_BoGa-3]